jgi:hypothetical protein
MITAPTLTSFNRRVPGAHALEGSPFQMHPQTLEQHAIRDQHVPRYLAEFEYRFNWRYDLTAMIPRFLTVAARTPPRPYRLLKLAEPYT